jgi:hypothetical protein
MSAYFEEVFQGKLVRSTGPSDSFHCHFEVQVPDLTGLGDCDSLSVRITGGMVEWAYLGPAAKVIGGTIELFLFPKKLAILQPLTICSSSFLKEQSLFFAVKSV